MNIRLTDLTQQFILPLWEKRDIRVIDSFVCPTAEIQTTSLHGIGKEALKNSVEAIFERLLPSDFIIEEIIQGHNKYIYHWSGKATATETEQDPNTPQDNMHFSGIISVEIQGNLIVRYHSYCNIQTSLNPTHFLFKKTATTLSADETECIIATIRKITGRRLTKREVECLNLWLKGFSIKETARFLGGLSGRTIQTFRENIKRKMNVDNYRQLFILSQKSGIISMLLD
jgi:DNA-binding CsgD family transcriptional regulator